MNLENNLLLEHNLQTDKTGLPYIIWIDEQGALRNLPHHQPRLKVKIGKCMISVTIGDNPVIAAKEIKRFRKSSLVYAWIKLNKHALLDHWYHRITSDALERKIVRI